MLSNVITDQENVHLRRLAQNRMHRSTVDSAQAVSSERTSSSADLKPAEDAIVSAIEQRFAALTNYPVSHMEPIQVLRYEKGNFYNPHHDYFDGVHSPLGPSGQRHWTGFIYLSDASEGLQEGETEFLKLDCGRLLVKPVRNSALLWPNCLPNGQEDERTLHAGKPPTAGVKYCCNVWIRALKFR